MAVGGCGRLGQTAWITVIDPLDGDGGSGDVDTGTGRQITGTCINKLGKGQIVSAEICLTSRADENEYRLSIRSALGNIDRHTARDFGVLIRILGTGHGLGGGIPDPDTIAGLRRRILDENAITVDERNTVEGDRRSGRPGVGAGIVVHAGEIRRRCRGGPDRRLPVVGIDPLLDVTDVRNCGIGGDVCLIPRRQKHHTATVGLNQNVGIGGVGTGKTDNRCIAGIVSNKLDVVAVPGGAGCHRPRRLGTIGRVVQGPDPRERRRGAVKDQRLIGVCRADLTAAIAGIADNDGIAGHANLSRTDAHRPSPYLGDPCRAYLDLVVKMAPSQSIGRRQADPKRV